MANSKRLSDKDKSVIAAARGLLMVFDRQERQTPSHGLDHRHSKKGKHRK